ncbi:ESPR-type extended signal peptide-containing protein, partial [Actinobacillus equuli]
MNKIFRVIWNEATQSWTAVSELAKGHVKSSSQSKVIDEVTNDYPTLNLSKTSAITATFAILGGTLLASDALAVQATITGKSLNTSGMAYNDTQGLAIGFGNATGNSQAIAIGGDTIARGAKASKPGAIAVGAETVASGTTSVALGWSADATQENTVALGAGAQATTNKSVALGAGSTTRTPLPERQLQMGQDLAFNTANGSNGGHFFAGNLRAGVVSVGNAQEQRQIQYVAPGDISQTSTDAVNGSQLYTVIKYLGFNVQENGASKARINNNNVVDFRNGKNTTVTVGTNGRVQYDVVDAPTFAGKVTAQGVDAGGQKITNVADGEIALNSKDAVNGHQIILLEEKVQAATQGAQKTANEALATATDADTKATAAQTAANEAKNAVATKADSSRAYSFNVKNAQAKQTSTDGVADNWTLSTDDSLTFGATSDLEVSTNGTGNIVYGLAETTKNTIKAAKDTADAAKATADTAKATADTAKATADTAKTTADTAKATADTAKTTADTAKTTADTAKATADTAKTTADTAKATADTAKTTADTAKTTADTAKATADTAQQTATEAKNTATAVSAAMSNKADTSRAYRFNIENAQAEQANKNGQAEGWDLSKDDSITFAATSDLTVSTDATGKIVYGLSQTAKTAISAASDAAKTVTDNLAKIEDSVKEAKDAATAAKASETKAEAAKNAAETAATAAASSATAADSSATKADSSASAASSSASAAASSATAADSSATKADSSASAASSSASAAASSATAADSSATKADSSASAASSSASAAASSATAADSSATKADSSASAASSSASAAASS